MNILILQIKWHRYLRKFIVIFVLLFSHCYFLSPTRPSPNELKSNSSYICSILIYLFQIELRRLYLQIQTYKSRAAARKDPSTRASKRRAMSRKHNSAASTHRRFSLQAFHGKHKTSLQGGSSVGGAGGGDSISGVDVEVASASRTPEESTNSAACIGPADNVATVTVEHEVLSPGGGETRNLSPCVGRSVRLSSQCSS